ncbi:hypothetical protein [Microbacterium invictum]|uniref:Uncharacterized protein n=1 Tax=Microbacterium invictum TaxID=515415 RepID=A0ABZ0V603_9MICO|nr:hypothetical protein [Microbacterium invictum]WQB69028.1 hypothetical protein T9R20_09920 [Microbacterium invictum]
MWREAAKVALTGENAETAIWAVESKLLLERIGVPPREISAGIREACWWIASLDDLITYGIPEPGRTSYKQARNADERGRVVAGIKWVRHRHSHQLAAGTTREGDLRPFIGETGGPPFFISRSWRWHTVEQMNLTDDELKLSARLQPAYERYVARHPVQTTIRDALAWFYYLRDSDS